MIFYFTDYAYLTPMSKYSRGDTTCSAQQDRWIMDAFEETGELIWNSTTVFIKRDNEAVTRQPKFNPDL